MYDEATHRKWLAEQGIKYVGVSPVPKGQTTTGCFVCKTLLPLSGDAICDRCGGIVCGSCGACVCGRGSYRQRRIEALGDAVEHAKQLLGGRE